MCTGNCERENARISDRDACANALVLVSCYDLVHACPACTRIPSRVRGTCLYVRLGYFPINVNTLSYVINISYFSKNTKLLVCAVNIPTQLRYV